MQKHQSDMPGECAKPHNKQPKGQGAVLVLVNYYPVNLSTCKNYLKSVTFPHNYSIHARWFSTSMQNRKVRIYPLLTVYHIDKLISNLFALSWSLAMSLEALCILRSANYIVLREAPIARHAADPILPIEACQRQSTDAVLWITPNQELRRKLLIVLITLESRSYSSQVAP